MTKRTAPRRSAPQRAIQAAVTPQLATEAALRWGACLGRPGPLEAVQNFVFSIELPEQPAILRLTHQSHRAAGEIAAELRWMLDLAGRRLPVAAPLESLGGSWLEPVDSAQGKFFAVCFPRLTGREPDPHDPALWSEQILEQLGALIAQLHQASYEAAWTPATLARRTWREESVAQNFHFYVPVGETKVHRAFDRTLARLDALPRSRDSFGLIHADLNEANFFITPSGLSVFDFDDSVYCWFAYDLLVPIYHFPAGEEWLMDRQAQKALDLMLRGYETVRRFNRAWLDWLPLFSQWRDLLIYGFFYEQLEIAALPPHLRATFRRLRERIETGRSIADFGGAR